MEWMIHLEFIWRNLDSILQSCQESLGHLMIHNRECEDESSDHHPVEALCIKPEKKSWATGWLTAILNNKNNHLWHDPNKRTPPLPPPRVRNYGPENPHRCAVTRGDTLLFSTKWGDFLFGP